MNAPARIRSITLQILFFGSVFLLTMLPVAGWGDSGIGCPHSAARQLKKAYEKLQTANSEFSIAISNLGPDWAYINVKIESVPGLKADGNTLDYQHPVMTPMVLYPAKHKKSFWMHKEGNVVDVGSNLLAEGVDELGTIQSDLSTKKFVVAESAGAVKWEEAVWSNTIVVHPSDVPKSNDLARFRAINERFLADFDVTDYNDDPPGSTLFITVAKNSGTTLLTLYDQPLISSTEKLVGQLHAFENNVTEHTQLLSDKFNALGKGGNVILYGDELDAVDIDILASKSGVNLIRRSSVVQKNLVETSTRLAALADQKLTPNRTVFLNAVPKTKSDLRKMSFPTSAEKEWSDFHDNVERAMATKFGSRLSSKRNFIKELSTGNSDIVMIVAHNDGKTFYLNGDRVTFDEIAVLPNRRPPSNKPRLAILVSCSAGKLSNDNGNRFLAAFRRNDKGFGELLVEKGFVDQVIAPSHEIEAKETVSFLQSLQKEATIRSLIGDGFPGWLKLATSHWNKRRWL